MSPSAEQIKSAVSTIIIAFCGALAGWAISKGYITQAQASAILANQEYIGAATTIVLAGGSAIVSAAVGAWRFITHRPDKLVATVAAMPEVACIITTATPAGAALADAVPSPIVTSPRI